MKKWLVRAIGRESPADGGDSGDGGDGLGLNCHANGVNGHPNGGDSGDGGGSAVLRACVGKATSHVCNSSENIPTIHTIPTIPTLNGNRHLPTGPAVEEGFL